MPPQYPPDPAAPPAPSANQPPAPPPADPPLPADFMLPSDSALPPSWPSALPSPRLILAVLAVVVVVGLIIWWIVAAIAGSSTGPAAVPTGQTVQTEFKLRHTKVGLNVQVPVTARLTAPVGWEATKADTPNQACRQPDGQRYLVCTQYQFSVPNGTAIHPGASGTVTVYDVSDWLTVNQVGQPAATSFAGKTTPSAKQAAFAAAESLNSGAHITPEIIKSILLNPVLGQRPPLSGIANGLHLKTADGQLSGYSYIATLSAEREYRPSVVVVLAGTIAESSVVVETVFELADAQMAQLATIPSDSADRNVFFANYRDGYEYGPDVAAAQATIMAMLKTLSIQP